MGILRRGVASARRALDPARHLVGQPARGPAARPSTARPCRSGWPMPCFEGRTRRPGLTPRTPARRPLSSRRRSNSQERAPAIRTAGNFRWLADDAEVVRPQRGAVRAAGAAAAAGGVRPPPAGRSAWRAAARRCAWRWTSRSGWPWRPPTPTSTSCRSSRCWWAASGWRTRTSWRWAGRGGTPGWPSPPAAARPTSTTAPATAPWTWARWPRCSSTCATRRSSCRRACSTSGSGCTWRCACTAPPACTPAPTAAATGR